MGYLGRQLGILKVKDANGDEPEMFELRFEDAEKAGRTGYSHSSRYLNEEQLSDALVSVGATPADLERILVESRANFNK